MTELLTVRQVAALLGMSGRPRDRARRLLRYLVAVEVRSGAPFIIRAGGSTHGRRYLVTLEALRQHAPELISRRDELVEAVRAELAELRERLEDVSDRGDLIADNLVAHERRLEALEGRVPERARESPRPPPG